MPPTTTSTLAQLWAKADRPGVRAFFLSITALGVALLLAVYSGAAAELGNLGVAASSALFALAIAAWVAVTLVPTLAKRTPLRWIGHKVEYKISRAGWLYFGATLLVALAALNTGNNLLFLILACLVSVILMSGILSSISLAGVDLKIDLPEHMFAGQTVRASVELINQKLTLPSFALRVEAVVPKDAPVAALLETPVFFDSNGELNEIFPGIEGSIESYNKGRGHDLHSLREYVPTDSASHVHWKASARAGSLMVREFAREEDRRLLLVLDPHGGGAGAQNTAKLNERFERAVTLCAGIAWHFYERNAYLQFRSAGIETMLAPAEENIFAILQYLALAQPVSTEAQSALLQDLAASPELFKIIVTSRARGTIPAELWHSSYVIFLESLEEIHQLR